MDLSFFYRLAADVILFLHVLIVVFNVFGLILIIIGYVRKWNWICNPWFRYTHIASVTIVIVQAWVGVVCPLTNLEMALRSKAGETVYQGTFISHWLESILYYQASPWFFVVIYTIFGGLVIVGWFMVRPRPFK